uniref:Coat protein n=1 Tax=Indian peanut clump virus D TaxID=119104 RepID=Q9IZ87_9VIRU|nr:coat protein [Indian peanut clump virus D]AAO15492.1 coat protein [Indian peanut clump virus D]
MANISEVRRGGGHYSIASWRNHVIKQNLNHDWWIRSDRWAQLLADLRAVNYEVNSSRSEVANIINRVPKDLPADPSARFPGVVGTPGETNYSLVYYVRVEAPVREKFLGIIAAADQGKSRDVEVGRPSAPSVASGAGNQAIVPVRGVNAIRDQQPLRDGSLSFRYKLVDVELASVTQFDQVLFEETFQITWIEKDASTKTTPTASTNTSPTGVAPGDPSN